MRRKDREVLSEEEMVQVLEQAECMHLGMTDGMCPYVVPVNYGYEKVQDQWVLWFHSAAAGKKIDLLRKNPHVFVEIDTDHELIMAEKGCDVSYAYASWMAEGTAYEAAGAEKEHGLRVLMKHVTGRDDLPIDERVMGWVTVWKIACESPSCKKNRRR